MVVAKDIYRVSVSLAAGTLCAWGMSSLHLPPEVTYMIAGLAAPAILASLKLRRTIPGWYLVFFLCGVLVFVIDSLMMPLPLKVPDSCAGRVSVLLHSIPFADAENNALLDALILGKKASLSKATIASFRTAGAAHLLALSGMHLGIIYLIVSRMLLFFGNSFPSRKLRRITVVAICGAYTLLCGAAPSLVRAWLFILLRETALFLDRPQDPRQIFCSALTLHLIISPSSISSIGFQLSYLAMVGIVFIWPLCRDWMESKIWQAASLSICCQFLTAPLTLLYFGTFPKYFLITNLIAAPLMSVVMVFGLLALLAASLWPGAPQWIWAVLEFPLTELRGLLSSIAALN